MLMLTCNVYCEPWSQVLTLLGFHIASMICKPVSMANSSSTRMMGVKTCSVWSSQRSLRVGIAGSHSQHDQRVASLPRSSCLHSHSPSFQCMRRTGVVCSSEAHAAGRDTQLLQILSVAAPWPPSAESMTFSPRKKDFRSPGLAVQLELVKPCEAVVTQM